MTNVMKQYWNFVKTCVRCFKFFYHVYFIWDFSICNKMYWIIENRSWKSPQSIMHGHTWHFLRGGVGGGGICWLRSRNTSITWKADVMVFENLPKNWVCLNWSLEGSSSTPPAYATELFLLCRAFYSICNDPFLECMWQYTDMVSAFCLHVGVNELVRVTLMRENVFTFGLVTYPPTSGSKAWRKWLPKQKQTWRAN